MEKVEITQQVRKHYAGVAKESSPSGCCSSRSGEKSASCCPAESGIAEAVSLNMGYSGEEINSVPEGANLGLGCGNPVALASLKEGEVILDLGSGAGFDCFLAANKVGINGRVIGVDMTPEMLDKARENIRKGNYTNVEFRLGEIENLPVADNSIDAVISNCVINLSPDKPKVFREAYRVLKSGGRMMVSDIVLRGKLPMKILNSIAAWVGCISGASSKKDYLAAVHAAGFQDVKVIDETVFPLDSLVKDPTVQAFIEEAKLSTVTLTNLAVTVVSIKVSAIKP
ncbi:MAG TPA: arsenite methyltransferase [Dehalococcoidales bacterium]|nr:arsenite methyltransferase [Dehalococcoidales bacterium]